MATRQDAIDALHRETCSCVILKDEILTAYKGPGISDLLRLIKTEPDKLKDAFVADKVIGKAAASLMILGKVDSIYTDLISDGAIDLLRKSPVRISFAERVSVIMNRTKNNICPMENVCSVANSPQECYERINEFIESKKQ